MITLFDHYQKLSDEDPAVGYNDEDAPRVVKFMAMSLRECGFLPEDMLPLVDEAERLCGVAEEAEIVHIRVGILKRCNSLLIRLGSPSVSFPPAGWHE